MLHNSFDMSSNGTSIQIGDFGTRRWAKKLPEDVWKFIDACLPLDDLFLHKQVSKAWRTRIAKNRAVTVAERVKDILRIPANSKPTNHILGRVTQKKGTYRWFGDVPSTRSLRNYSTLPLAQISTRHFYDDLCRVFQLMRGRHGGPSGIVGPLNWVTKGFSNNVNGAVFAFNACKRQMETDFAEIRSRGQDQAYRRPTGVRVLIDKARTVSQQIGNDAFTHYERYYDTLIRDRLGRYRDVPCDIYKAFMRRFTLPYLGFKSYDVPMACTLLEFATAEMFWCGTTPFPNPELAPSRLRSLIMTYRRQHDATCFQRPNIDSRGVVDRLTCTMFNEPVRVVIDNLNKEPLLVAFCDAGHYEYIWLGSKSPTITAMEQRKRAEYHWHSQNLLNTQLDLAARGFSSRCNIFFLNRKNETTYMQYGPGVLETAVRTKHSGHLWFMILGLTGEAAELMEATASRSKSEQLKELGDVAWYCVRAIYCVTATTKSAPVPLISNGTPGDSKVTAVDMVVVGAGKIADAVKKAYRTDTLKKRETKEAIKLSLRELYGKLYHVAAHMQVPMSHVMDTNLAKLQDRKQKGTLIDSGLRKTKGLITNYFTPSL